MTYISDGGEGWAEHSKPPGHPVAPRSWMAFFVSASSWGIHMTKQASKFFGTSLSAWVVGANLVIWYGWFFGLLF
jgi:hypothetical protein